MQQIEDDIQDNNDNEFEASSNENDIVRKYKHF